MLDSFNVHVLNYMYLGLSFIYLTLPFLGTCMEYMLTVVIALIRNESILTCLNCTFFCCNITTNKQNVFCKLFYHSKKVNLSFD